MAFQAAANESGERIRQAVMDFLRTSPMNSLRLEHPEPAWDEAVVGFSSGADPIFQDYKEHVGTFHYTPKEIFDLTYPDTPARAEELTVISWVLPQREPTRIDNRKETFYPSKRWVMARFPGEECNSALRKYMVEFLAAQGIQAVAPLLSPHWKMEESPKYGFASRWSERHAAYAAGLGTFGLCDGLITEKGKAHRVGSVVARMTIPPTPRPYTDHHAYCLFYLDGTCRACMDRCPVGAISEKGHDKIRCREHTLVVCGKYIKDNFNYDGYGCGLCQTGVPCESAIPPKAAKRLGLKR